MSRFPTARSLTHLESQVKCLLQAARKHDPAALSQIGPCFGKPSDITLQQARLVIARDHGFSSWARLEAHVKSGHSSEESTEQLANRFLDLVCLHYGPDPTRGPAQFEQAAALLDAHPEIAGHSLHSAAAAGDMASLQRLLDKQVEQVEQVDDKGGPFHWTPLMYAAYSRLPGKSTYAAGKCLLDAGADPNAHYLWDGIYRFTVLTGVFGDGEGGIVRLPEHPEMEDFARALLDAGANPNDSQGAYNRCFSPDNRHLELMLEYGLADSDPSDWWLQEEGHEPEQHRTMHFQLIIALRWGFAERARLLIEHGVDIDSPDNNYYPTYTVGHRPYQVALMRGMPEIAELIRSRGGRAEALDGHAAFQAACMSGDTSAARVLAGEYQGVDPHKDQELLREAAGNGQTHAVSTMIALGFDLSPRGTRTALHAAAWRGHTDVIRLLVEAGADTSLRDPDHHSAPISHAMHGYQSAAVELLMECAMDIFTAAALGRMDQLGRAIDSDPGLVNSRFRSVRTGNQAHHPNDWATPLWFAIVNAQAETAAALLANGAEPDIRDEQGRSIADHARTIGNSTIIALFE